MKRATWIFVLSIASIFIASIVVFIMLQGRSKQKGEAIRAIPIDAGLVLRSDSYSRLQEMLYQKNEFWEGIGSMNIVSKANHFLELSQKLKESSPVFRSLFYNNTLFMSAHPVGKGTTELLFAANIPEGVKPSDVKGLLEQELVEGFQVSKRSYNEATIYTYTQSHKGSQSSFSFSIYQGVAVYSQSILLVESALGQLDSGISLLDNPHFVGALQTAGTRVVGNLFVNYARLPNLFLDHVHPTQKTVAQRLNKLGRWGELDLTVKNDAFFLNGFAHTPDSISSYFRVFARQKPVEMGVHKVLPNQTAAFAYLGISNLSEYLKSMKEVLKTTGKIKSYEDGLKRFGSRLSFSPEKFFLANLDKEVTLAFIPFEGESYAHNWFVATKVKSQSKALQELQEVIAKDAQKNGVGVSQYEQTFVIDRDKSVKIYRFPESGLHRALFGEMFSSANDAYFTTIDSYLIFGSSFQSLSRFVLSHIHNKQLALEPSFMEFAQGLTAESNFLGYMHPAQSHMLFEHMLSPKSYKQIESQGNAFQQIQGIGLQLTAGKGMVYHNIYACYSPYTHDSPKTVWETRLDTTIAMKPQLVVNHTTQAREIFVQDENNNIYLINEVGRVLWKRPLSEPIMGEVHQIDAFRNGKLQFLFNTKSSLWLIDRNGNHVEGFPVQFLAPATNPVAVFDYENNRDYRFFIAHENLKVTVYNKQGRIVPGWEFEGSEKTVAQAIQHFRVDTRDYIVLSDANRLYVLDRRGSERTKSEEFFTKAANATISLERSSKGARLVTTDSLGVVKFVYLNGKVESKVVQRVTANHVFDLQDMNGDGMNDFIFLDQDKLSVYNQNGKEIFSQKFKEELLPVVIYFHFGAKDRKLGVVSAESSQLYLINGDGTLYKGFPLRGITPFSIGRFAGSKSTFNLIVGSSSGYVLNYAVQ